jgi:hypothetical protein
MPITHAEAQEALRDISRTGHASATTYGYRHASPHLIVWGIIWALGYGICWFRPQCGIVWPALVLIGIAASTYIGWQSKPAGAREYDWRYASTALAVFAFIAAQFAVMPPRTDAQVSAFFPILVALFYAIVGIWTRGARMLVAGVVVAALTLAGYFLLPQYFALWMAVVGGGALILGGIWLRSV